MMSVNQKENWQHTFELYKRDAQELGPILQIKVDKILATPDVYETESTDENFRGVNLYDAL